MKTAKIYYKGLLIEDVLCDSLDSFDGYFALTIKESDCKHKVVSLIPKDHLIILKEDSKTVSKFRKHFQEQEISKTEISNTKEGYIISFKSNEKPNENL
jgi:hypothetical protein